MKTPSPGPVAFDTETFLIRPALKAPPMVCLTWADSTGQTDILGAEDACVWWEEQTKRDDISWVGHNLAFDICVMLTACPQSAHHVFRAYDEGRMHDTLIREQLFDIAQGRTPLRVPLAKLAQKYLGIDRSAVKKGPDVWRMRYNELAHIPVHDWPDAAVSYAIDDASDTLRVAMAQIARPRIVYADGHHFDLVQSDGSIADEGRQVRAALALHLMTTWGLRVDQRAAHKLQSDLQKEYDGMMLELSRSEIYKDYAKVDTAALKKRIIRALTHDAPQERRDEVAAKVAAKGPMTATAHYKAVVEAWLDLGYEIPTTAKGQVATGKDILEYIDDPLIQKHVEAQKKRKKLTTYMDHIVGAGDYAVCPSYTTLVRSGRTSSSKPNVQNFPRAGGERECFVPRAGCVFVAADYSTLELRSWAQVCLDMGIPSDMADALHAGEDLHAALGSTLMGVSYEYMMEALDGEHGPEVKTRAKLFRGAGKPGNFGLPVGMGAEKLDESARKSYGVDFKVLGVTAEDVREAWYLRWSEAKPYHKRVSSMLKTVGTREVEVFDKERGIRYTERRKVRKCTIEHPRSGRVRGGCYFTDAANSFFQGMAADGAKKALWDVARACYADKESPIYGCRPVAFIHDEIILEVPFKRAQAAAKTLCDLMIAAMETMIPDVPIICEADIMDRWSKKAESKTLDSGDRSVYLYDVEKIRAAGDHKAADLAEKAILKILETL